MNIIKVSVVISVYNVEKYLRRCLDSVCNQTLREIEIIAVNDASPDGSAVILGEYAENDSRIKIITHVKNSGQGAARNTGMAVAVGEYIAFIDSDDWLGPEMYESMYRKALEYDADMVVCGVDIASSETQKQDYLRYRAESRHTGIELIPYLFVNNNDDWGSGKTPYIEQGEWNKIFRRKLVLKHGITHLSRGRILGEDAKFIMDFLCFSRRVVCIPEVFYNYWRSNQLSMTRDRDPEIILSSFDSVALMRDVLTARNLFDTFMRKRLNGYVFRQLYFAAMGLANLNRETLAKLYERLSKNGLWCPDELIDCCDAPIYQIMEAIRSNDCGSFNRALRELRVQRWKFRHIPKWITVLKTNIVSRLSGRS